LNYIKTDPDRFHKLFNEVPLNMHDSYVMAFANGFAESNVPGAWTFDVFRRYARQENRRLRQALSYAIQKVVRHHVPEDIVANLVEWVYVAEGEDESWWVKGDHNGDIYNSYFNSDRGAAFGTLMRILDEASSTDANEKKWQLIEFASCDTSFALRIGAIDELSYMTRVDPERSWLLFEKLIAEHELLLETRHVREFLHWSLYKNFMRVKPFIEQMLKNPKPEVQEMGAELACISDISESAMESEYALAAAKSLANEVIRGQVPLRKGAASVYTFNMTKGSEKHVRALCLEKIRVLVNDEDEEVRNKIKQLFFGLSDQFFFEIRGLMEDITHSDYYPLSHQFAEYLWNCGMLDPAWTLSMIRSLVTKTVRLQRWESGAEELMRFALRVYTSPVVDAAIRYEAMNTFDVLMMKYADTAHSILLEWDRR
jgi:hypothetical protein